MTKDDEKSLRMLQFGSILEATTLAVLVCVAVPLKHAAGYPMAVSVMGPIHGIAFIAYIWAIIVTASAGLWRPAEVWRLVLSALVPFAGFASTQWIARKRNSR
ncbi:DUF3817 domain-containing protein [Trinickia caryophylli]|uniref:Integral membrane protein n=1 Tax=Trinickia caryophylli TaxID=28094 RepID=A0A1X7DI91_TRICW|nr:DUF3817 domain-containing protein [Trinickia caryophylli]PMS12323.1 DUF3817 domain-containing protein [Trinickia caryophylli]TRX17004.1 DUF3817 domain-containing protein [Trinickia caryophylli]WQE12256.1 DUF3817 domain-containing protein [Trinickia caryophylli]SMF15666.1 integral membrane protein [Trinickia caryophylli]GLU31602.1 hypothetical protein Busp01_14440 [Trinickia caryophylli]